ncbi:hypothetical protein RE428_48120 [Marinobacter nanhaiticus D15-8W]|uniref:CWH43-like N-terminal domain-containing protein n=1 Tax=Marinobacter nanhaiticus D15-8W TaxID=626887 RepID=N6VYN1_9GAMM|nr:hypothetical protein [Marinobacter nanhaiticus]ENO15360.1 hypothetical protein J057_08416 [Marinobacter nanhaiticus D15-8W]BES73794.1 hypothetical protein RE428_48120 [Marinobacter nanhaiticus D15-8W]
MQPNTTDNTVIPLWWMALAAALIPLVTIHTTYFMSAIEGHVDWCVPYWESCTSISRTGRHGVSYFIFKGTMLPAALLGMFFWWLNLLWLRQLGAGGKGIAWLPWLGLVACLALASYTLALGHRGDEFQLIRRIGVVLYFALTYIAQLLLSAGLQSVPRWSLQGNYLLRLCQVTLAVGLFSVVLDAIAHAFHERFEDAFEWVLALLVNTHALWIAILWRQSAFHATFRVI